MNGIAGKSAVITGAGSGIGQAVSIKLAELGASVGLIDLNSAGLQDTQNLIQRHGVKVDVAQVSVSNRSEVKDALTRFGDNFGKPISIGINCAGIIRDSKFLKMSDQQFDEVIDCHLKGTFIFTQLLSQMMLDNDIQGSIINTGSVAAKMGNAGQANYVAAKAGIVAMTKTVARELGPKGIRCNVVIPGFIETPMTESVPGHVRQFVQIMTPLGRFGKVSELASTYVFLASDESLYITGTAVEVSGGLLDMICAPVTLKAFASSVPAAVLIGSAPPYLWLWFCIRVLTLPLPKRWYHKLEQLLCWGPYQRFCMFFMEGLSGIEFKVYGDVPRKKDAVNALFVANHQCVSDWVVVDSFAMRLGNAGYIHFFAKNALKFVPMFGVYWHQHGLIFVRKGMKDKEGIRKQIRDKRINNIPMMMTLFPEGTRFNPERVDVIEKSHAYARSVGLSEFKHVLTPRIAGANMFVEELGDHLKKIYDVTIVYESIKGDMIRPDALEFLDLVRIVHFHIRERDLKHVQNEEGWLFESFREKDALIEGFEETKSFPDAADGYEHIYTRSVWKETLVPVLYTAALCAPLFFSRRLRKLYLQTLAVVPLLQIAAIPFWK